MLSDANKVGAEERSPRARGESPDEILRLDNETLESEQSRACGARRAGQSGQNPSAIGAHSGVFDLDERAP